MKLAVGVADIPALKRFQTARAGANPPLRHLTRTAPRRAADLLAGGSIFWVIGGWIVIRQRLLDIRPDRRPNGEACCALVLDPVLVPVESRRIQPFQGWRYLSSEAAPPDLGPMAPSEIHLPAHMAQELRKLGLL